MDGTYNPDTFLDFSQYNNAGNVTTSAPSSSSSFGHSSFDNRPASPFFNAPSFLSFQQESPFFTTGGTPTFSTAPSLSSSSSMLNTLFTHYPIALPPDTPSPPHCSSSTPSPPHSLSATPSPPQQQSVDSLPPSKRKRTTKDGVMKINNSIQWEDYMPPDTPYTRLLNNLTPIEDVTIHVGHIDKNAIVEPDKCIIYRQNQFKLQCVFNGGLQHYSTPPSKEHAVAGPHITAIIDNRAHEIDGLFMKLYAFKQNGDETTEEYKVPIHQVGPSRTKKETKPPEIMPISSGGVLFDKLQFQASTHVGSDSYFRIVITLLAKIQEKYHVVSAKISPKLLVRAQNPGRYCAVAQKPMLNNQQCTGATTSPETDSSQDDMDEKLMAHIPPKLEETYSPPNISASNPSWIKEGSNVHYFGKVGINTANPQEALTVNGNILVTGDVCKPSDRRLKRNFVEVNPASQLNVINQINIYDYDVQSSEGHRRERGVIAQELAQVLPSAVHRLSSYPLQNGQNVDNLLVVNERMLLMENIGATQYLDQVIQQEREEINFVNSKVDELEQEEQQNSSYVMKTIQNMGSLLMSEDFKETANSGWIYCGFSLCGLGPAWSMFLIGFFFQPAWCLGALYITSRNPIKRAAGLANVCMITILVLAFLSILIMPEKRPFQTLIGIVIMTGVAFLTIISCYKRNRERLREKVLKNNLKNNLKNIPLEYMHSRRGVQMQDYVFPDKMGEQSAPPAAQEGCSYRPTAGFRFSAPEGTLPRPKREFGPLSREGSDSNLNAGVPLVQKQDV